MNKPSKCKNCQWYGKPYWSIVNPCDNCPMENVETFTQWVDPTVKELKEENEKLKAELYDANITKDNYVKLINRVAEFEEENKKLKEKINNLEKFKYNIHNDKTETIPTMTKSYKNEYEDYKSRINKALKDTEELYKMVKEQDSDNVNLIDRLEVILKTLKDE